MAAFALARLMVEGIVEPRRSARRVLDAGWKLDVAVQLTILAYLLQSILTLLFFGHTEEGSRIGLHLLGLVTEVAVVGVVGLAVWAIGGLFGGRGSREDALLLVAWHTLVTTLLTPFLVVGALDGMEEGRPPSSLALLLFFVAVSQYFWILGAYTAELHRFQSPWGAFGIIVAVVMLFGVVALSLVE